MKDKIYMKFWFWAIIIIVLYMLYRLQKGYWTLGYIPLLGYEPRMANPNTETQTNS